MPWWFPKLFKAGSHIRAGPQVEARQRVDAVPKTGSRLAVGTTRSSNRGSGGGSRCFEGRSATARNSPRAYAGQGYRAPDQQSVQRSQANQPKTRASAPDHLSCALCLAWYVYTVVVLQVIANVVDTPPAKQRHPRLCRGTPTEFRKEARPEISRESLAKNLGDAGRRIQGPGLRRRLQECGTPARHILSAERHVLLSAPDRPCDCQAGGRCAGLH